MADNSGEDLLTVDELAAKLRLKRQTIYNKVHRNEIPHVKVGGALRFSRTEIADWIAGGRSGAVVEQVGA